MQRGRALRSDRKSLAQLRSARWQDVSRPREVLRLLRGEDLESVSRALDVTAATLTGWHASRSSARGPGKTRFA